MNDFETQLKKETSTLRLSYEEKERMRGVLEEQIVHHPLRPVASPYQARWPFPSRAVAVSWGITLGVALMSGTAYAAQGTLPGDLLYPIKIHVTEPVAGALAISTQAKAQWNAGVAQERVQEAEKLAYKGDLTASATQEIQTNFDMHATQAIALTQKLKKDNPSQGLQLSAQLSASLEAHSLVLESVAQNQQNPATRENAKNIAEQVQIQDAVLQETGNKTASSSLPLLQTQEIATSSRASKDTTAVTIREKAVEQLSLVEANFNLLRSSLSATTTDAFDARVAKANLLIEEGDTASTTSPQTSRAQYEAALEVGIVLQTFLDANKEFKGDILVPLLQNDTLQNLMIQGEKSSQGVGRYNENIYLQQKTSDTATTSAPFIKLNTSVNISSSTGGRSADASGTFHADGQNTLQNIIQALPSK